MGRALEVQKEVCLCYVQDTKAFDKVWHDEIITQLTHLKIDGKDQRAIKKTSATFKALEVDGIEKIIRLVNEMYDTSHIPQDISKSILITLLKKPEVTVSESHRTISLMSHIFKIL